MLLVMVVLLDLTSTAQRWYARALIAKSDPGEVGGAIGGCVGANKSMFQLRMHDCYHVWGPIPLKLLLTLLGPPYLP